MIDESSQARTRRLFAAVGGTIALLIIVVGLIAIARLGHRTDSFHHGAPVAVPVPVPRTGAIR